MILKIAAMILFATTAIDAPIKVNYSSEVVQDELDIKIHATRTLVAVYTENNREVLEMFETLVSHWKTYNQDNKQFDIDTLLKSISFAAIQYDGQYLKDNETPYLYYPLSIARILFDEGRVTNINVLVSAILQDVLVYTDTQPDELEFFFDDRVLETVQELSAYSSDDQASQLSMNAQLIKLSDRIYYLRSFQQQDLPLEYVYAYKLWGQNLLNELHGTNSHLEAILQQEILT